MIMDIKFKEIDNAGVAYIGDLSKPDAAMTYSFAGDDLIIIDHTEVSDKLRGQGTGRQLLDAIVEMVRQQKKKILPLCPYAKSVFDKDASISDVLRKA